MNERTRERQRKKERTKERKNERMNEKSTNTQKDSDFVDRRVTTGFDSKLTWCEVTNSCLSLVSLISSDTSHTQRKIELKKHTPTDPNSRCSQYDTFEHMLISIDLTNTLTLRPREVDSDPDNLVTSIKDCNSGEYTTSSPPAPLSQPHLPVPPQRQRGGIA
ncbi:hypothetical protein C0Q70_14733 [Pomacea canaliculata]|uniref:Uncharacterized protein n=1 Tax=Pomacea canaliculata TaxID=400727 RepID=A0A2T7NSY4_POMCA|nr:hypothetical protein C0Q70_14733 [Pomacea canaliculata]